MEPYGIPTVTRTLDSLVSPSHDVLSPDRSSSPYIYMYMYMYIHIPVYVHVRCPLTRPEFEPS